jgi:hypothetical protein
MKKIVLLVAFVSINHCLFAQQNTADTTHQFLFVVRYKSDMKMPGPDSLKKNSQHWGAFIGGLTQSGKLVTGFRPAVEGVTITGSAKIYKKGAYIQNGDEVSSIFVIKAANIEEAASIAQKCPVYEFDGSVEIRPVLNSTN